MAPLIGLQCGLGLIVCGLCLQPLSVTLSGITNDSTDPSVDIWRTVSFPLIRRAAPVLNMVHCVL